MGCREVEEDAGQAGVAVAQGEAVEIHHPAPRLNRPLLLLALLLTRLRRLLVRQVVVELWLLLALLLLALPRLCLLRHQADGLLESRYHVPARQRA
jgi:hypothetical protein